MSRIEPLIRIPVGIVVERCQAKSAWAEFTWRPFAILPGVPETTPWTILDTTSDRIVYYAGAVEILLYRADSSGYRDNLRDETPMLWVALRSTGGVERPYDIYAVTADPGEGETYSENSGYLVEGLPMPNVVRNIIADFVFEHQTDRLFIKRQRDRANPEALARSRIVRGNS